MRGGKGSDDRCVLSVQCAESGRNRWDLSAVCPDTVKLVPAVLVGPPDLGERLELGEIAQPAIGRLGHGPLPAPVTAKALGRRDPEALRGLLVEEARALAHGNRSEKEARAEANGARGRRDEVREVAEGAEIEVPALGGEERSERLALRHVSRTEGLDPRR